MARLEGERGATLVARERSRWIAQDGDGARIGVQAVFSDEPLVIGARVRLRAIHARPGGELEAFRVEIDEAHRVEYEALLLAELEREALAAMRAGPSPPNAPLEAGHARAVIVEESGLRRARLEDGRLARFRASGLSFRTLPGVHVIVRGLEERRGELRVVERDRVAAMERDEAERESYERIAARERFEDAKERAARRRAARGEPAHELPARARGRFVDVTSKLAIIELEGGARAEVAKGDWLGVRPAVGLSVIASRFFRRPDGRLAAEEIALEEATRAALEDARRTTSSGPAETAVLEAKLLEDPSDDGAWRAYRAALEARGDPRAELMAIEHEIEREGATDARVVERRAIFDRHRDALLGPFADPEQGVELAFVRGHVFSARIRPSTIPPDDRVATLLSLPSARFVWSLAIEAESHEAYRALARSRHPSIRRLEMGRRPDVELKASPGPLARALPRLRELVLSGPVRSFEVKDLLHLSRLELRAAEPWPETLPRLMSAEWPALEALVVWLGAEARAAELAPLFAGAIVPRLRELGLCNTTITNHVCRALARSPLLARLRAIDLSLGTMTDGGAAAIGAAAAAFAHVEALDATSNLLTPIGEEYLRMAVPPARTEGQRPGYGQGVRAPGFAASDRA